MIDLSATAREAIQEQDNFENIDPILDLSERSMLVVAAEHDLHDINIQRWRWDQPEILMSWLPSRQEPYIGKNIRVLVKVEEATGFRVYFESNAWYDDRRGPGMFIRYWAHFPAGDIPLTGPEQAAQNEQEWFRTYLERAYVNVSDDNEVTLDQSIVIWSDGRTESTGGQPGPSLRSVRSNGQRNLGSGITSSSKNDRMASVSEKSGERLLHA